MRIRNLGKLVAVLVCGLLVVVAGCHRPTHPTVSEATTIMIAATPPQIDEVFKAKKDCVKTFLGRDTWKRQCLVKGIDNLLRRGDYLGNGFRAWWGSNDPTTFDPDEVIKWWQENSDALPNNDCDEPGFPKDRGLRHFLGAVHRHLGNCPNATSGNTTSGDSACTDCIGGWGACIYCYPNPCGGC